MADTEPIQVGGILSLDVEHLGLPGAICAYVVEGPEPALVDPGPTPALPRLKDRLREVGFPPEDLRHILLTHVHLDHAGSTGHLAREFPALTVHVHEDGAPHMADPERLVRSTRRTFGEAHDRLWGEVVPIPSHQIRGWRPGDERPVPGIRPLPTPGHIAHHLAFEAEGHGVLFTGDSLGIILGPDAPTHPPTPPPAVDLAAWEDTLTRTLAPVEVDAFGVTHFGLHRGLHARREELRTRLLELAERVREALARGDEEDRERYDREVVERLSPHVSDERVPRYFSTFPAASDWDGMRFFLERNPDWKPVELA